MIHVERTGLPHDGASIRSASASGNGPCTQRSAVRSSSPDCVRGKRIVVVDGLHLRREAGGAAGGSLAVASYEDDTAIDFDDADICEGSSYAAASWGPIADISAPR